MKASLPVTPARSTVLRVRPATCRRSTLRRSFLAGGLAAAVGVSACSQTPKAPGQLVVSIETDMALPDQVDTVRVQILIHGEPLLDVPYPVGVGPDTQPIPATLTLLAGSDPTPVTIRVLGQKNGVTRTLREAVTPVPTDRTASLRMPIQWLCDGSAQSSTDSAGQTTVVSTCGDGFTCSAGMCVPSPVMSPLPTYEPESVFGGGTGPGTGTCFDTLPCMIGGSVAAPDAHCTIPRPAGGAGENVALLVANNGICDSTGTTCFVPLDGDSIEGWTEQGDRLALPQAACDKLQSGVVGAIIVSNSCATKTEAIPPCGKWSSVNGSVDASAPADVAAAEGTTAVASLAGDGGAGLVCCPLMADAQKLYTCLCTSASNANVVAMDVASGNVNVVAAFAPHNARPYIAAALADGAVFWTDRVAGDGGTSFSAIKRTALTGGPSTQLAVVRGDIFDETALLSDTASLFALADNVQGAVGASVQLLKIDRASGGVTPLDTASSVPVYQFAQDSADVYVVSDVAGQDGGATGQPGSRIVRIVKTGGPPSVVTQFTSSTQGSNGGGYVGIQSDGTALYALSEGAPAADGTIHIVVVKIDPATGSSTTLYDQAVDPTFTSVQMLGVVDGAVLLNRTQLITSEGGPSSLGSSSVIILPSGGGAPRIAADFPHDAPVGAVQAPAFDTDHVYWVNAAGGLFRFPRGALQ